MTRRKVLAWSAFAVLVLLAAAAGWLWTADLGVFKPQVERFVAAKTGRDFSIDGRFSVNLGGQSVVVADGIRFANPDWAADPHMVEVGHVEIRIDTWSLIKGPLQIDLVEVADAAVHLERSDAHGATWEFATSEPKESSESSGVGVLLQQADVKRVRLTYTSPDRAGPIDLRIERFTQEHDSDDFLQLDLQASVMERDVAVRGSIGTWPALLSQQNVQYRLQAQLDTLRIESEGYIDDLLRPRRPELSFSAQGPDVSDLERLLRVPEGSVGDINLSGSLAATADGPLVLDVAGNLGQLQAEASGSFSDLEDLENAELELQLTGDDLGRLLGLFGIQRLQGEPFAVELDAERQGPTFVVRKSRVLIADAELEAEARLPKFPSLDDSNIRAIIRGKDFERFRGALGIPGASTGAYSLAFDLNLDPAGVEIVKLDLVSELVRATINGQLGEAASFAGGQLQFEIEAASVETVGKLFGMPPMLDRPATVSGAVELGEDSIQTRGPVSVSSLDIEGSVDGRVVLAQGIRGSDFTVELSGPDLAQLIREFATVERIPAQPYDVAGRLRFDGESLRFSDVLGEVGSSSVRANGEVRIDQGFAGLRVDFDLAGPALEDLVADLGDMELHPGPYELSSELQVDKTQIQFDDIEYVRPHGEISGDFRMALPVSTRQMAFDVKARGNDLHEVFGTIYGFEADEMGFAFDVRGDLQETEVSLDELNITVGEAEIAASGELDFGAAKRSTRFSLDVDVPDLARLGSLNGLRLREQGFALHADVRGDRDKIAVENLSAKIDESDVHGSISLEKGDVPLLKVDIRSDSLRFAPLLEERELEYDPEPRAEGERLVADIPVPFDVMRKLNATVNVSIGDLRRDKLHVTNLNLRAELLDGAAYLHRLGFNTPAGWLEAKGALRPAGGNGAASVAIKARDFALGVSDFNPDLAATGNVDINLESQGTDLRSLVGNASGVAYATASDLTIVTSNTLRRIYGDMLNEILSAINPFSRAATDQKLECVVMPLELVDGKLLTQPYIVALAPKFLIGVTADANLNTGALDMNFRITPRRGITLSAGEIFNPYVKVVGTISRPRLAVDEQGVLISGGAAVATGGLSILAKAAWSRISQPRDPCGTLVEKSTKLLGSRFSDLAPPPPN